MEDSIITRAGELGNWSIGKLREFFAGFDTSERPTKIEVEIQTKGMTRGQLIEGILRNEFVSE